MSHSGMSKETQKENEALAVSTMFQAVSNAGEIEMSQTRFLSRGSLPTRDLNVC